MINSKIMHGNGGENMKIKSFITAAILGATLALGSITANATTKDTVKPSIKGVTTKTVYIGQTFQPLKGVSAYDKVDGNLSNKIKVTGKYNLKKAGTYTLVYSVKDKAKNTRVIKRKLIVKPLNVTLKQKSQYFKAKGGFGTLTIAPAKTKLKIAQLASKKWMKTTSGKWVKDGFIGNYVYLNKQTILYNKVNGKKSSTLNGGIYHVSKTTENGWIHVSVGWIKSGEFVDSYIDYGNKAKQQEIIKTVNKERAKEGRKALKENPMLTKIAIIKSMDMAKNHYFSHYSPVYGSFDTILRQANYKYYYAGENIATGQRTAADFMNSWMNSAGHRANILNANFKEIGVGVVENIPNAQMPTYGTQEFGSRY